MHALPVAAGAGQCAAAGHAVLLRDPQAARGARPARVEGRVAFGEQAGRRRQGTCPSFSFSCILTWGRLGMRSSRRGCAAAMLGPARRQRKHGPGRATSVSDVQLPDELPEVALPGQV